jgi:selenocysteine lyase/cysteine desulfurase
VNRRSFLATAGATALANHAIPRIQAATKAVSGRAPDDLAADEDFWFEVRHAFTLDRTIINLNNGSVCPSPQVVQRAQEDYWRVTNMQPSYYVDEMLIPGLERVRQRLASSFGCDPEEMAITRNTSESLSIVQMGLDLQPGDEVLTTTQDYPHMLITWQQLEDRRGIKMRQVPYPTPPPTWDTLVEVFERAITPRTKVILLCHVTYTTGQIFPVGKICRMARARGIETVVDGAHGFAQFPFRRDDLDCDYYGTSLHKWLTAPVGTGFLYVRKDKIGKLWPLMAAPREMKNDVRKFEQIGTYPVAVRAPIAEALAFQDSLGIERKAARLRYLRRRWANRLAQTPRIRMYNNDDPNQSCAIGACGIEGIDVAKLVDHLMKKYRIHVRPRWVSNEFSCIRITPNVYTALEEIDAFSEAMETIARKGIA